jgi:predicted amidophosphoribosyltransferase
MDKYLKQIIDESFLSDDFGTYGSSPEIYERNGFKLFVSPAGTKKIFIIDSEGYVIFSNLINDNYIIITNPLEEEYFLEITIQGYLFKLKNPLVYGKNALQERGGKLIRKLIRDLIDDIPIDCSYFCHKIFKALLVEDKLIISGYISNKSSHDVLYPDGKLLPKQLINIEYQSNFSTEGYGNGVSLFNFKSKDVIKSIYFNKDLNFNSPVRINRISNILIMEHEERTHILFLDDLKTMSFGGDEYKLYTNYILFFPHSGYSSFNTFALVDFRNKRSIDLYERFKSLNFLIDDTDAGLFYENQILIDNDLLVFIDACGNRISIEINDIFSNVNLKINPTNTDYYNTIRIFKDRSNVKLEGPWKAGYSLDYNFTKTKINSDGSFITNREKIGELLYQYKYKFDKSVENVLAEFVSNSIQYEFYGKEFDVILPIPPSNVERPYQPVIELSVLISKLISIPVDIDYINKLINFPQSKEIPSYELTYEALQNAFMLKDIRYKNKNVLLFDDLFWTGATLNIITELLYNVGQVKDVYVVTILKNSQKEVNMIENYGIYHPYHGGRNELFDGFSSKILELKENNILAVNHFFNLLKNYFDEDYTITVVPSHDPLKTTSGLKTLAQKLATFNNWTDATSCLIRTKKIGKLAHGGNRSIDVHLNSIRVNNANLIRGKNVLVLDDVTTSGNSLLACKKLLKEASALNIRTFAIAKTSLD